MATDFDWGGANKYWDMVDKLKSVFPQLVVRPIKDLTVGTIYDEYVAPLDRKYYPTSKMGFKGKVAKYDWNDILCEVKGVKRKDILYALIEAKDEDD